MRSNVDRHAAKTFALASFVMLAGFIGCAAASSVSPATRDAVVRTALDEAKYQCVTNPPNDARLQAACLALLGPVDDRDAATVDDSPVSGDGGPMNVGQGNAVRSVDGGP